MPEGTTQLGVPMRLLSRCRSSASASSSTRLGLWLLLLPLSCASAGPPAEVAAGAATDRSEHIALAFAWPAGFSARVAGAESSRLVTDVVRDESRTQMSYRLSLEPHPGGVRIRYDDFSLHDPRTDALVRLRSVPGLETLTAALRPSFVVATDGRFGGTPGLEEDVAAINRALDALHARPEGLPEGSPLLPTRFSAELFRRHAPVEWEPLVELWAGREIVLGERYRVDLVTRMPLLDGVPIRMDGELQVSGRVPCDGGNGPARCVELVLVTRPDPLELLPLLGADAEQPSADAGPAPVTVTRLELDESVRLVTEPETLVPYRVETRRRARLELRMADGSVHSDALDQESDLVFHPES